MTLDELKAKLPVQLQPWVDQYGPVFLAMSGAELKAWVERVLMGDMEAAYRDVVSKLDNAGLLSAWDTVNAAWKEANVANAAKIAVQKEALVTIVRIMLAIALAAVGL